MPATTRSLGPAALAGLLATGAAQAALPPEIFSTRMTFSAYVREDWLPGPTLYDNSLVIYDAPTDANPPQKLELLHYAARGVNWSGHSGNINQAFGSATTQSDGNGGVGVTQTVFTQPDPPYQQSVFHLAAQSLWTQTFTNNGTLSFDMSLQLYIPELRVGLIGVAPNRNSLSATESATASARVDSVITHADGSMSSGPGFELAMRMHEEQYYLGASNSYANFWVIDYTFTGVSSLPATNCNTSSPDYLVFPDCSFDAQTYNVKLGRMDPGDTMAYTYTLTASGTTEGSERGFFAFLGDPFSVNAAGGSITPGATLPVPEPRPALLLAAGLALLALRRREDGL